MNVLEIIVLLPERNELLLFVVGFLPVNVGLVSVQSDFSVFVLLADSFHAFSLFPETFYQMFELLILELKLTHFLHQLGLPVHHVALKMSIFGVFW